LRYTFEWDPIKAAKNFRKHRISFDRAAEIFLDRFAISVYDQEHSEAEHRWVTIGKDIQERTLVLVHTFSEVSTEECTIRIISARKADKRESRQYEEAEP
jgi:uncharacterized DUF497 family protein